MSHQPLVTVICTCYNHSEYVEKALNSVSSQTYKNIQLIIVDDYSSDNSIEIIESWLTKNKADIFIKNETNLGLTKSFNRAFKKANGEFFIDLAADDKLLPHCVEKQVFTFNQFPKDEVAIVYGNASITIKETYETYLYFDRFPQEKRTTKPNDGLIYKELIDHSNTICSVSAMVNSNLFKKVGCYDENLEYEDYDLWLRFASDYPILYIDDVLVERLKVKTSLGNINYKRFNKKAVKFKYSTYLVVKKTFNMNQTKAEDLSSIRKIKKELKDLKNNYGIFHLPLVMKYLLLWSKFKYRQYNN